MDRFLQFYTLEAGLIVGLSLIALGVAVAGWLGIIWLNAGFGDLDYRQTLRIAILSVASLGLGVQLVFSSFFLSILRLKTESRHVLERAD